MTVHLWNDFKTKSCSPRENGIVLSGNTKENLKQFNKSSKRWNYIEIEIEENSYKMEMVNKSYTNGILLDKIHKSKILSCKNLETITKKI